MVATATAVTLLLRLCLLSAVVAETLFAYPRVVGCCRLAAVRRSLSSSSSADRDPEQQRSLRKIAAGESLLEAGDCLSRAACCLPNWYSSKEGLTGESPAVFGGAGTALCQAGEGLVLVRDDDDDLASVVSDLFLASCSLEPVGLGGSIEIAASALERGDYKSLHEALEDSARDFETYGEALDAEEHESDRERETAGKLLQVAGSRLRVAGQLLGRLSA